MGLIKMVELKNHNIVNVIRSGIQVNLESEEGLVLALKKAGVNREFFQSFEQGEIQIAWGNYKDSHPIYLAIFYKDKRVYPNL